MLDNATDARIWDHHHAGRSGAAARAVAGVRDAFEVLACIRYAAPWRGDAQASAAGKSSASNAAQPSGSAASRS